MMSSQLGVDLYAGLRCILVTSTNAVTFVPSIVVAIISAVNGKSFTVTSVVNGDDLEGYGLVRFPRRH